MILEIDINAFSDILNQMKAVELALNSASSDLRNICIEIYDITSIKEIYKIVVSYMEKCNFLSIQMKEYISLGEQVIKAYESAERRTLKEMSKE